MEYRLKPFDTLLDIRRQYEGLEVKPTIFLADKDEYEKIVDLLTIFQLEDLPMWGDILIKII